jgi:GDP-4-dehydro-6-deoxy-D-mannose reductase
MRFRPVDEPVVVGDNSRLRALGWAPQMALEQSLAAILDYWRGQGSQG